jgi:hypothetical protein
MTVPWVVLRAMLGCALLQHNKSANQSNTT